VPEAVAGSSTGVGAAPSSDREATRRANRALKSSRRRSVPGGPSFPSLDPDVVFFWTSPRELRAELVPLTSLALVLT
jgi:hypothetical protein